MIKKKARPPKPFRMPRSGFIAATCETQQDETEKYFQLRPSGSLEPKTAKKLAEWLLKAAKWMELK